MALLLCVRLVFRLVAATRPRGCGSSPWPLEQRFSVSCSDVWQQWACGTVLNAHLAQEGRWHSDIPAFIRVGKYFHELFASVLRDTRRLAAILIHPGRFRSIYYGYCVPMNARSIASRHRPTRRGQPLQRRPPAPEELVAPVLAGLPRPRREARREARVQHRE